MKFCLVSIVILLSLVASSCVTEKGEVTVKLPSVKRFKTDQIENTKILNVKIENNQLVVTGTNLDIISKLKIESLDKVFTHEFIIESKSSNQIIANSTSPINLAVSSLYKVLISNSYGSASFEINFNLCNASFGSSRIDCTLSANDKDVLSYDSATNEWKPRAVNGLNYLGSFDASSGTAPTAQPSGSYYIISVAGVISGINFEIGDWIVSNGVAYQKIDNSSAITSVFGRTGAVTALEGDYSLDKLLDVDLTVAPVAGKVLKFDGTKWVASDDLSGGGAGSVSTSTIADGAVTDLKISDVAASKITGTLSASQIGTGVISNVHISNTAAIDYSKLNIGLGAIPQDRINGLSATLGGLISSSITNGDTTHAPSSDVVYDNLVLKFDKAGGSLTPGSTITGLPTLPLVGSEATSKDYVDNKVAALTTTNIPEGTNYYFTIPRVHTTPLTGVNLSEAGTIVATDSILQAFGKTQKQITDINSTITGNQWAVSGSDVYRATGKVGIGTNSPQNTLDVRGTITSSSNSTWGSGANSQFKAIDSNGLLFSLGLDAGNTKLELNTQYWSMPIVFSVNNSEKMRILNNGNVGVGTNSPTQKLDVAGNINATQICIAGDCKSSWPSMTVGVGSVTTTEIADGTIQTADLGNTQVTYAKLNLVDGDIPLAKLNGASDATKYLRGDKTWSTFATDAINSVLSTFTVGTGTKPAVVNTDTVVGAFGKVQKTLNDINADYVSKTADQVIFGSLAINSTTGFITVPTPINPNDAANKAYVDGFGQWLKNGSNIYFNTGNVGVGTLTPAWKLHINGSGKFENQLNVAPTAGIHWHDTTSSTTSKLLTRVGNAYTGGLELWSSGGSLDIKNPWGLSHMYIQMGSAGDSGNIGIGTTTPGAKLEIAGQVKITGGTPGLGKVLTSDATGLATWEIPGAGAAAGANTQIQYNNAGVLSANSQFVWNHANSRLGIGTASPNYKIDVVNGTVHATSPCGGSVELCSAIFGDATGSSPAAGVFGVASNATAFAVYGKSTGAATGGYFTSSSGAALVTGTGNVGLGVNAPTEKLEVNGDVKAKFFYAGKTGQYNDGGGAVAFDKWIRIAETGDPYTEISWGKILIAASGRGTSHAEVSFSCSGFGNCDISVDKFVVPSTSMTIAASSGIKGIRVVYDNATFANPAYIDVLMRNDGGSGATTMTSYLAYGKNTTLYSTLAEASTSTPARTIMLNDSNSMLSNSFARGNINFTRSGSVGIGTTNPAAKLDVAGEIKLGNTSSTCNATTEGQQRYNSTTKLMEFCNGTSWLNMNGARRTVCSYYNDSHSTQINGQNIHNWTTGNCTNGYPSAGCVGSLSKAVACGTDSDWAVLGPNETPFGGGSAAGVNGGVSWSMASPCNGVWVRAVYECAN